MPYSNKDQQRLYQKNWIRQRRLSYFSDKTCVKCGSNLNLQLDHIDESTKVDHRIWSWSEDKRNKELAKCQVLCELCHKNKTKLFNSRPITHGTKTGYNRGCRCNECHQALLLYWRNRRNIPE